MIIENVFPFVLLSATLLCVLVAGFILLFAIVVMPGIGLLPDREFLRSFQVIDGVIQNNQPLFLVVWIGSALTLTTAAIASFWVLEGKSFLILTFAAVVYLTGVQLPTVTVNIPLNNQLQSLDLKAAEEATCLKARESFEARWNRWNMIRTIFGLLVSVMLLTVLRLL